MARKPPNSIPKIVVEVVTIATPIIIEEIRKYFERRKSKAALSSKKAVRKKQS